jgi:phospholipase C
LQELLLIGRKPGESLYNKRVRILWLSTEQFFMPQFRFDRRTLLKAASAIAGGASLDSALAQSIQRAAAIDPEPGSTFEDAEHIVFLMQENRSFDHAYGSLQGVRGFNDPRAIDLPDGRPVWLQADAKGDVYAPFRMDMLGTNVTWHNGLPHDWPDQVDARNHGKYDGWLRAKRPGKALAHLPQLCLGYHTRDDLPFYYRLADAFTICDQHFCSTLTGTNPNRLHFWTGTIRPEQKPEAKPHVYNGDIDFGTALWTTYPERLSAAGVSWKVYQNELTTPSGLTPDEDRWCANFGDNVLEYFAQYRPFFSASHVAYLRYIIAEAPAVIAELGERLKQNADAKLAKQLAETSASLARAKRDLPLHDEAAYQKLPARERDLHERGLATNRGVPEYREVLKTPAKSPHGKAYNVIVPKSDILANFRADVQNGNLPTVSWLVAPQSFSDHPSTAWFGAWYVSEVLNILTSNPEVWKKTIFVLNYDENDGYFDHVPPFVAPVAGDSMSGGCSEGVDSTLETTTRNRNSPVGLGYRVPLVVASPWSRGGWVNSQVFDLTSPIRFLETYLKRRHKLDVSETNITSWRRTVVGDMTSIFRPWNGEATKLPEFVDRDDWVGAINNAFYKPKPAGIAPLTAEEIETARRTPAKSPHLPRQEPGTRPSCALPYELRVEGQLTKDRRALGLEFTAGDRIFGAASAGCPFQVYSIGHVSQNPNEAAIPADYVRVRNYAVAAGKAVRGEYLLGDFANDRYQLRVYGPNGFYRELLGNADDPEVAFSVETALDDQGKATGELVITARGVKGQKFIVALQANAYGHAEFSRTIENDLTRIVVPLNESDGWYDFNLSIVNAPAFKRHYAGRIETGTASKSDPVMGRIS